MKHINISILLTILMSMVGAKVSASYDIAVENEDGITLYYNYISNGKELEVTNGFDEYEGIVRIPESVTYMNRTRKVTSISASAFSRCANIRAVTIPSGVTTIKANSFESCFALKAIDIPDNVIEIRYGAFLNCHYLAEIRIGAGLKRIGDDAFKSCGLKKVIVKDISAYCSIECGNNFSSPFYVGEGRAKLYGDDETEITNLEIPENVSSIGNLVFAKCPIQSVNIGNKVESIGAYAFFCCQNLASVKIGNGVTTIGNEAFGGCHNLTSVKTGTGITTIGNYAFSSCEKVKEFSIGFGVKTIGEGAFYGCAIETITIPDNVQEIGSSAFGSCVHLQSVTLGNGIAVISGSLFSACISLKAINIPENITAIGGSAFQGCRNLVSVTIPAYGNLAKIGQSAFVRTGITSITIPYKVTEIGRNALNVSSLSEIKSYLDDPITISSNVFSDDTYYNASLIVPKGTLEKYKGANVWEYFVWVEEGDYSTEVGSVEAKDRQSISLYSLDGKEKTPGQKGFSIIRLSDGTVKKVLVK